MDPQTRTALVQIVQDRDQARLAADASPVESARWAEWEAQVRAYNLVLATFAEAMSYGSRNRLELALATGTDLETLQAPRPEPVPVSYDVAPASSVLGGVPVPVGHGDGRP